MKKTLANEMERAEIVQRLNALTGTETAFWGRMTVSEMVCHVREAFRAVTEARTLTPGTTFPLPPEASKWLALESGKEWRQGIPGAVELNSGQPGVVPQAFGTDRASAIEALHTFCTADVRASTHPYFGAMSEQDWLRWGYLHADHHLRQFGQE